MRCGPAPNQQPAKEANGAGPRKPTIAKTYTPKTRVKKSATITAKHPPRSQPPR